MIVSLVIITERLSSTFIMWLWLYFKVDAASEEQQAGAALQDNLPHLHVRRNTTR